DDAVVAAAAGEEVVAAEAKDRVVAGRAGEIIVAFRADDAARRRRRRSRCGCRCRRGAIDHRDVSCDDVGWREEEAEAARGLRSSAVRIVEKLTAPGRSSREDDAIVC